MTITQNMKNLDSTHNLSTITPSVKHHRTMVVYLSHSCTLKALAPPSALSWAARTDSCLWVRPAADRRAARCCCSSAPAENRSWQTPISKDHLWKSIDQTYAHRNTRADLMNASETRFSLKHFDYFWTWIM